MQLADRLDDAATTETALRQIETARDVGRHGERAGSVGIYDGNIPQARAVLGRLLE